MPDAIVSSAPLLALTATKDAVQLPALLRAPRNTRLPRHRSSKLVLVSARSRSGERLGRTAHESDLQHWCTLLTPHDVALHKVFASLGLYVPSA